MADRGLVEGGQPGLRLELPDGDDGNFGAVLQLRSRADPSLVIDAADLWGAPAPVLRRFGEAAEGDLLLALRRAGRVWPPAERALDQPAPAAIELDDDEATALLGPAAEELAAAGFEVLWPSELAGDDLTLRPWSAPRPRGRSPTRRSPSTTSSSSAGRWRWAGRP